ncbi:MAG: hypothetical protein GEV03_09375 [Streptosporangiales bacterium]|nr:hypothetical protein [Streptosporangiales bacterium]
MGERPVDLPSHPVVAVSEREETVSEQERVQALLHAVIALSIERDPDVVARTIVATAIRLVDARFGALAVAGASRRLRRMVTASAEDVPTEPSARDRKRVRATLIHLIEDRQPRTGPGCSVALPIDIDGRTWGGLYVEGKRRAGGAHGEGSAVAFDDFDESTLRLLLAIVRPAIENTVRLAPAR